eukprot:4966014-Prymnesium_polylepis.1
MATLARRWRTPGTCCTPSDCHARRMPSSRPSSAATSMARSTLQYSVGNHAPAERVMPPVRRPVLLVAAVAAAAVSAAALPHSLP